MVVPQADPRGYRRLDLSRSGVIGDLSDLRPRELVRIGQREYSPLKLPRPLRTDPLGVIVPEWLEARVIHRFPQAEYERYTLPPGEIASEHFYRQALERARASAYVDNPRPVLCGNGDYLLSVVAGDDHYGHKPIGWKLNDIFLYRSRDRGQTWDPPVAVPLAFNQHGWPLMRVRHRGDGNRLIATFTNPAPGDYDGGENAGLGWCYSDDHGHTWSTPQRISPINDPGFQAMWCIQPTETASGAWLIAPHDGHWVDFSKWIIHTRLYVLRTGDGGQTWEQFPGPRNRGWQYRPGNRMDEGRPIALADGTLLLFARTAEGHIWMLRGSDDGRVWSEPQPTALVHPDAPPMISTLSDGQTLIALFHNYFAGGAFAGPGREQLWVSLSKDAGQTWTPPRFLIATNTHTTRAMWGAHLANVTYCDTLADRGMLHIFVPHNWRQVLHLRLPESELERLPTVKNLVQD